MLKTIRPNVLALVILSAIVSTFAISQLAGNPELIVAVATAAITGTFAVVKDMIAPVKSDLELVLEAFAPPDSSGK